jgi:hypothetical protein
VGGKRWGLVASFNGREGGKSGLRSFNKIFFFCEKNFEKIFSNKGRFIYQNVRNQILRNLQNECLTP